MASLFARLSSHTFRSAFPRTLPSLTAVRVVQRANMSGPGSALPHQQNPLGSKSHEAQSNIGIMKTEPDGSFRRKASSFRRFIEPNGELAPEKGTQGHP